MTQFQKIALFLLRISVGWFFFWAGITKVLDPTWSAIGYLENAKTLKGFYYWFASPDILPVTNFLNEWGLTLIGATLVLGVFVRLSSLVGILFMMLYYFALPLPHPNAHVFLVDDHVLISFILLTLTSMHAGRIWGLENRCTNLPICAKFPKLRAWLG